MSDLRPALARQHGVVRSEGGISRQKRHHPDKVDTYLIIYLYKTIVNLIFLFVFTCVHLYDLFYHNFYSLMYYYFIIIINFNNSQPLPPNARSVVSAELGADHDPLLLRPHWRRVSVSG